MKPLWESKWEKFVEGPKDPEKSSEWTPWSGTPTHHPYANDMHKLANDALTDLNGAFVAVGVMASSSPGHPVNQRLKMIEKHLRKLGEELSSIVKDIKQGE